jgi:hypothetical protein
MFRRNFQKSWKSSEHLTTRRNTLRFRVNGSASSRDYFIASNHPRGRDLFALLAQGYGCWHRILIAHQLLQSKEVYKATLVPMLRASRSRCRFHRETRIATPLYDCLRQLNRRPASRTSFRCWRKTKKKRGEQHLKRLQLRKAIGPHLNKAGLTSGNCLPCQNDNKFLVTERS